MMMNNFEIFTSPAIIQPITNHRRRLRNSTLALLILISISCNDKEEANLVDLESNNSSVANVDLVKVDLMENSAFKKITNALELKRTPLIDSTNFDNFSKNSFLNKRDVTVFQLEKIYPEFHEESYHYKATPSYSLKFSEQFYTVVIICLKGEMEMETILINYDLQGQLIDSIVISYDEIAESWSRIESKVELNKVTITKKLWIEEKQEEIKVWRIHGDGKII